MKPPDLLDDPVISVLLLSGSLLLPWGSKNGRSAVFAQVSSIFSISSPYFNSKASPARVVS